MRDTPINKKEGGQRKGKEWPIVPGNYSLGGGDYRAVAEIRESITLPEELYIIKGKIVTPNLGIVRLVRNIVSNPNICYLILTGSTIPGFLPGQALLALKSNGVDSNYRIIGAKGYRPVVRGLTEEELKQFRDNIQIIDLRGKNRGEIISKIKDLSPPDFELSPIVKRIPTREVTSHEFRNERMIIGTLLEQETFSDLWPTVLRHIWLYGNIRNSERGKVKEVLSLAFKVREPIESPYNKEFHMNKSELDAYAENLLHPTAKNATYTYGDRLFNFGKLDAILAYLRENKNTRRGLVSLWDPQVDVGKSNPPCFVNAQFLIRDESLHLITYWRSQDMWGAAPANWYGLSQLMEYAAKKLGVSVGTFTSFSASAHVYKTDWKRVKQIIGEFPRDIQLQTPSFRNDTSGYFLIELEEEIIVEHRNTTNELLYRITGTNSEDLSRKIAHLSPGLTSQHLLYLGRELKKAEVALTSDKAYTQDKPLNL